MSSDAADGRGRPPIPTADLLADLQRVADELDKTPTVDDYDARGDYHYNTLRNRFGSWQAAKEAASVTPRGDGDATTCPYGHWTLSWAVYCHQCGQPIDPETSPDSPVGKARIAAATAEAECELGAPRDEIVRAIRGVEEALAPPEVEE